MKETQVLRLRQYLREEVVYFVEVDVHPVGPLLRSDADVQAFTREVFPFNPCGSFLR